MTIDGHAHACGPYLTPETIAETLIKNNIDYVVLTAGEMNSTKVYKIKHNIDTTPCDDYLSSNNKIIKLIVALSGASNKIKLGNEYVYNLRQKNNKVLQYYWLTNESISELSNVYDRMKFHGLKLHQVWKQMDIESPSFHELVIWLEKHNLPLFIHLYNTKDIIKLGNYISKKGLSIKIIVAHLYGFEKLMELGLGNNKNLMFDISNAYFISTKRLEDAINILGPYRLCFGSDTPYGEHAITKTLEKIKQLSLTDEEKEHITGLNLKKILSI